MNPRAIAYQAPLMYIIPQFFKGFPVKNCESQVGSIVLNIHETIMVYQSSISSEFSAGCLIAPLINLIFFFAPNKNLIAFAHSSKLGTFNRVWVINLPGLSLLGKTYGERNEVAEALSPVMRGSLRESIWYCESNEMGIISDFSQ